MVSRQITFANFLVNPHTLQSANFHQSTHLIFVDTKNTKIFGKTQPLEQNGTAGWVHIQHACILTNTYNKQTKLQTQGDVKITQILSIAIVNFCFVAIFIT